MGHERSQTPFRTQGSPTMRNPSSSVSVIICTRNQGTSLARTLRAIGDVHVPPAWDAELVVVDNASTDHTAAVVRNADLRNLAIRYLYEGKKGKSFALNRGVAETRGEVLLWTDDDVIPARNWLESMATPLLDRRCDAVWGPIEIAAHLQRPWMRSLHKWWLAAPDAGTVKETELIGANMGFHRSVLQKVPAFDPELGPGALGFGEDSLFSFQLAQAGFRFQFIEQATVVHDFDPSRLLRSAWLEAGRRRGRVQAYLLHHWQHGKLRYPRLLWLWLAMKLSLRRILQPQGAADQEGCALWEISYVGGMAMCSQFRIERHRPRNYTKRGLERLSASGACENVAVGRSSSEA